MRRAAIPVARALTTGATADRFRGLAEFVAQEEMARHEGFWWSPAGDRLLFAEVDQREVEQFSIADPARPEREPLRFRYPRPGLANARVQLGLIDVVARGGAVPPITWLTWDHERYPYVARVLWDTPRAPLAVLVQTRDQRQVVAAGGGRGHRPHPAAGGGERSRLGEPGSRSAALAARRQRLAVGQRGQRRNRAIDSCSCAIRAGRWCGRCWAPSSSSSRWPT